MPEESWPIARSVSPRTSWAWVDLRSSTTPWSCDGGRLRFLEEARVVDRVADVGHQGVEELQVGRAEGRQAQGVGGAPVALLGHVDHADHPVAHPDRHADERAVAVLGIVGLVEAGIGGDVVHQDRLAHLHHLAGHALAHLHLDRRDHLVRDAAGGRELQHRPVPVEDHDRADGGADRAHRRLEHEAEQVLDARDARGQLDHLVEGAELEDEVLEALGRAPQVVEHVVEGVAHLPDLGDLAEPGNRGGPLHPAEGLGLGLGGRDEALGERGDLIHHPPEDHEAQDRDPDRGEEADLRLGGAHQLVAREQVDQEEDREQRDQREDHRGRFAEAHGPGPGLGLPHGVLTLARVADLPNL